MSTQLTISLSVIAGLLTLYLCLILTPQVYRLFQLLNWRKHKDKIVLTYDDGPDSITSLELLKLLDELGVKATFYLVGFRAERAPGVIQQLAAHGHELGVHSYSHWHAWKVVPWREYADVERAYRVLSPYVDPKAPYRPPFGKITLTTLIAMRLKKRRIDWWTSPTNDTEDEFPDVARAASEVLAKKQPVILMHSHHDEPHRRAFMLAMTRAIVEQARAEGLKIVTMEMLTNQPSGT